MEIDVFLLNLEFLFGQFGNNLILLLQLVLHLSDPDLVLTRPDGHDTRGPDLLLLELLFEGVEFLHHGLTLHLEGFVVMRGPVELLCEGGVGGLELDQALGGGLSSADGLLCLGEFVLGELFQVLDVFLSVG